MREPSLLPDLALFLSHWQGCREPGHSLPTLEGWLERLTGQIALRSLRIALTDGDAIVQFIGSSNAGLLGYNITGTSVFHGNAERRELGMPNFLTLVRHPCG